MNLYSIEGHQALEGSFRGSPAIPRRMMTRWTLLMVVITITLQFLTPHASIFHIPMERQGALLWCNIYIGTPAQTFRVQVDTGSSHLWVLGKSTKKVMGKAGRVFYNGRSKSAKGYHAKWWQRMSKKNKKMFEAKYVLGDSFNGEIIIDDIKLDGGATLQASLAIVTSISRKPKVTIVDGIMGLGLAHKEDSIKSTPFLQQLLQQISGDGGEEELDDGGVLSVYLSKKSSGGGELSFGGDNMLRFKGGTMNYFPVHKHDGGYHWWDLTLDSVGLGSKKGGSSETGVVFGKGSFATIDTGCSHIFVPESFFGYVMKSTGAYWSKLGNSGKEYPVINCADRQNVDDVVFTIGGIEHRLTGEDYFSMVAPNFCVLQLRDIGQSDWMLGQPFLRKYYSVFNLDKKEIGLAEANHEHDITLTASTGLSDSNITNFMQEGELVV